MENAQVTAQVELDTIKTDGTQVRVRMDQQAVNDYAEAMKDGAGFPPVVVFFDGTDHWVADGHHRVSAARVAGLKQIDADIHEGGERDALLFAVGANAGHGLRRTNADKHHAVSLLLADMEWSQRSDRWIAERCTVSDRFVNGLRASTANASQLRVGKDGKIRKAKAQPTVKAIPEPRATTPSETSPEVEECGTEATKQDWEPSGRLPTAEPPSIEPTARPWTTGAAVSSVLFTLDSLAEGTYAGLQSALLKTATTAFSKFAGSGIEVGIPLPALPPPATPTDEMVSGALRAQMQTLAAVLDEARTTNCSLRPAQKSALLNAVRALQDRDVPVDDFAAARLGCRIGQLPCLRIGAQLRFEPAAIRAYALGEPLPRPGRAPTGRRMAPRPPSAPRVASLPSEPGPEAPVRATAGPSTAPAPSVEATASATPPPRLPDAGLGGASVHPPLPVAVQAPRPKQAELIGIREAASRMSVCAATVYRLCEEGVLPHVRSHRGNNWIGIDPRHLDAALVHVRGASRRRKQRRPPTP